MLATAAVAPYGIPTPPLPDYTPSCLRAEAGGSLGRFSPGHEPGHEPLNLTGVMPGMAPDSSANMMTSVNALTYATALAKGPLVDPLGGSRVATSRLGPFFSDVGTEHDDILGTMHSTGQWRCIPPHHPNSPLHSPPARQFAIPLIPSFSLFPLFPTPPQTAAHGEVKELRQILSGFSIEEGSSDIVDPDEPDAAGRTASHLAAMAGEEQALTVLLEAGADPDAIDLAGNSVLHYAACAKVGSCGF